MRLLAIPCFSAIAQTDRARSPTIRVPGTNQPSKAVPTSLPLENPSSAILMAQLVDAPR